MKRDIVIFGSNGMLGHTLVRYFGQFPDRYNVMCVSKKDFCVGRDDNEKLRNMIPNNSTVINSIGMIPQKYTLNEDIDTRMKYIQVNGIFPHVLYEIVNRKNGLLIHIATDCVYDGLKGKPYQLNETPTESNIYGFSKACGEPSGAMIIRTSIIGEEKTQKKSLLEWVKSQTPRSEIKGFENHHWNGVCCLELSKIIDYLLKNNITWEGVQHIISPDFLSKHDLVSMINEIYNLRLKIKKHRTEKNIFKVLAMSDESIKVSPLYQQINDQKKFWETI
jgi:dTDP-4-dehydrorhamnose reductase